jgi:osmotically-inducible protein OsmY
MMNMNQRRSNYQQNEREYRRDERMRDMPRHRGRERYRGEHDWRSGAGGGYEREGQGYQGSGRGYEDRDEYRHYGGGIDDLEGSSRYSESGRGEEYSRDYASGAGWSDVRRESDDARYGLIGDEMTGGDYLRGGNRSRMYGYGEDYERGRSGSPGRDYGHQSQGREYGQRGYQSQGREYGGQRDYGYPSQGRDYGQRGYPSGRDYGQRDFGSESQGRDYGYQGQGSRGYGSQGSQGHGYPQGDYGVSRHGIQGDYRERTGYGQRSGYGETADYDDDRSSMYGSDWQSRGSHRGKGPKNYTRSDERIREDLCERLTDDDSIDASGITIMVSEGVVTLDGSVAQRWMKHRAEDMAEACSGVKDVTNRLRVGSEGQQSGQSAQSGQGAQGSSQSWQGGQGSQSGHSSQASQGGQSWQSGQGSSRSGTSGTGSSKS